MEIRRGGLRTARIVCRQLNQIPRDEARRYPQMPKNLHQEPGRGAAGPRGLFQGLLACLDARIQPRHIVNFASYPPSQNHQESDRSLLLAGKLAEKSLE